MKKTLFTHQFVKPCLSTCGSELTRIQQFLMKLLISNGQIKWNVMWREKIITHLIGISTSFKLWRKQKNIYSKIHNVLTYVLYFLTSNSGGCTFLYWCNCEPIRMANDCTSAEKCSHPNSTFLFELFSETYLSFA